MTKIKDIIEIPNELVAMIEFRRASFEYSVLANLLEMNKFTNEALIEYLREQSKRFTIAHDRAQAEYAQKNAQKAAQKETLK